MTLPVPNLRIPLLKADGTLAEVWQPFFQQFTQAPSGIKSLIVTASPFSYVAREPGLIAASGIGITGMALIRGSIAINVTGVVLVPIAIKDTFSITFTSLPTIQFIPNF